LRGAVLNARNVFQGGATAIAPVRCGYVSGSCRACSDQAGEGPGTCPSPLAQPPPVGDNGTIRKVTTVVRYQTYVFRSIHLDESVTGCPTDRRVGQLAFRGEGGGRSSAFASACGGLAPRDVVSSRSLFDGRSLARWRVAPRLPTPGGAAPDPQSECYANAAAHPTRWSVQEGTLVGQQAGGGFGGYLVSQDVFGDFGLAIDVWPD
jgi:hypothetical protein